MIINDILDYSKMEAGKVELALANFAPRETIAEGSAMLLAVARAKGIELDVIADGDLPALLRGEDASRRSWAGAARRGAALTARAPAATVFPDGRVPKAAHQVGERVRGPLDTRPRRASRSSRPTGAPRWRTASTPPRGRSRYDTTPRPPTRLQPSSHRRVTGASPRRQHRSAWAVAKPIPRWRTPDGAQALLTRETSRGVGPHGVASDRPERRSEGRAGQP